VSCKNVFVICVLTAVLSSGCAVKQASFATERFYVRTSGNWYLGPFSSDDTAIIKVMRQPLLADLEARGYEAVGLTRTGSGLFEIPFAIQGHKGSFLLDSGAGNYLIYESLVKACGLEAIEANSNIGKVSWVFPKNVAVGDRQLDGFSEPFRLRPSGGEPRRTSPLLVPDSWVSCGIVGAHFLRKYHAVLDFASETVFLKYEEGSNNTTFQSFENTMKRFGYSAITMTYNADRFAWTVPGSVDGKALTFTLDTGANTTGLDLPLAEDKGFTMSDQTSTPMQGEMVKANARVSRLRVSNLKVGSFATLLDRICVYSSGWGHHGPAASIGTDLLARHAAIIDFGNDKLYLSAPRSDSVAKSPAGDVLGAAPEE